MSDIGNAGKLEQGRRMGHRVVTLDAGGVEPGEMIALAAQALGQPEIIGQQVDVAEADGGSQRTSEVGIDPPVTREELEKFLVRAGFFPAFVRSYVRGDVQGGLDGTSTTDIITAISQVEGSAGYAGFERFTGALDGRQGTFVLQHNAEGSGGEQWMTWRVLPDSGTGDLRGIRGEGQIIVAGGKHSYHLDYELD